MTDPAGKRTTPRRPIELVAVTPDQRGTQGLAIAVTISKRDGGLKRQVFLHDDTPESLAGALYAASEWVSAGAP